MAKSTMARIRLALWALTAVVAFVAGAIVLGHMQEAARQGASLPGAARFGGDFTLVDHNGETYSSSNLSGKPYAIFFGFTHCPDICPTTLFEMTKHLDALREQSKSLQVLFVTVDPERDTPQQLKSYLTAFDPTIVGLTGSPEQLADVTKKFRIVAEKVPTSGGDYTMNHTASVYLFSGDGKFSGSVGWDEDAATRQKKLERLVERG